MKLPLLLFICFSYLFCRGQITDTLGKKLDSLEINKVGPKGNITKASAYNEQTKLNFKSYFMLLGSSLKQEFTAPLHWNGKEWVIAGAFVGVEAALMAADEPVQRWSVNLSERNTQVHGVGQYVTQFGGTYEAYVLAGLGAYSFIFKNQKLATTTLLATQSYITGAAVESVIKFISGRQRPATYTIPNREIEPSFKGPFASPTYDVNGKKLNSSFPSGHTTVAFAAATVFAMEYKNTKIVPILSYGAASLIGLSRITENRHWLTDVIAGAALGYFTGKHVVDNYHRFARLKSPQTNKLSFNLHYNVNHLEPGLVYTFN